MYIKSITLLNRENTKYIKLTVHGIIASYKIDTVRVLFNVKRQEVCVVCNALIYMYKQ